VDKLVEAGLAYPCFCTDEELEAMKKEAEVRSGHESCDAHAVLADVEQGCKAASSTDR
jgi:glutamyl/glutaminyl-tRNA synthetase